MAFKKKMMAFNNKPQIIDESKLLLSEKSPFLVKEDYKVLRTNVEFSFADVGPKVIAVTSSARSEGKSTNSINLALSFAELSNKVLLMDCDLRLPTVASKLKLAQGKHIEGLTDVLVWNLDINSVVRKYQDSKLNVVPAGTTSPDPTKLLQSEKMRSIIESLKESYDYIILDCPPVTEVIDAALLAPLVDGYLLVVKHGESDHRNIVEMLTQLDQVKAKILGFAYVNAPVEEKKYYKKGSGRYYYYKKNYSSTE